MTRARFEQFAWSLLIYNLAVIVWGVYVRASFSGDGCGPHWPLCSGQTLAIDAAVKKMVEFTHRLSSGAAIILVLVLLGWAISAYPPRHRVRTGALYCVIFTFSEAIVGAGLVLFRLVAHNPSAYRAVAVTTHLTNTFILLAALTLTAWCASGGSMPQFRGGGFEARALTAALVLVTILGISGTLAALGDTLYPSSSILAGMKQDFAPTANYLLRLRPFHPFVAIVTALYVGGIASVIGKRKPGADVKRFKRYMMFIFSFQLIFGFLNLMFHAPVWMQLLHLFAADGLWIALVLFSAAALPREEFDAPERELSPQIGLSPA